MPSWCGHPLSPGHKLGIFYSKAMSELTPKQEAFAQAVASGKSQSDAYRAAYTVAITTKADTVNQKASRLMSEGKVRARVEELRAPVVEAAQITLASHLERLRALSAAAEAGNQFSAAIAAEVARGKASGLYVEKTELTGANGGPVNMSWQIEFVKSGDEG